MKSFISKFFIAAFGLTLVTAPLTANAAQWGVGVNVGGPGYTVHAGYANPGGPCYRCERPVPAPRYGWREHGWAPAPRAVFYDGYYGAAPGGYYGYYWHGRWFGHRRWGNGFWVYF
jgi:hypothetical protein